VPVEADRNMESDRRRHFIQRSLEVLLQDLDPDVAKIVYISAVPHWFDQELLHRLAGDEEGWENVLEVLLELQLAQQDSQGHVRYQDEVRKILLSWQRQNGSLEYLEANRISCDYFLERANQAPMTERPRLEREALYHQLVFDESGGLRLLNQKLQEAYSYHQLDSAELLVDQVEELRAQLSRSGQQWLNYFAACQELAARKYDLAEALFGELASDNHDIILGALINWRLGQVLVAQHRWSQAMQLYEECLKHLGEKDEPANRARVLLSLADAYRNLAEHSGGYAMGLIEHPSRFRRFLLFCQHLPFLCLEWVVQRVSFLPSLYFGTDYQNWIIDRLLFVAEGWMAKAERLLARTNKPVELSEARLALAGLEHQVGRWSRARRRYTKLEADPVITNSEYRFAKVRIGQGRASLTEGKLPEAIQQLSEAARTFQAFQDPVSTSTATFLLGQAFTKLGKPDKAAEAFLDSAEASEAARDNLALTRALWSIEALTKSSVLPEPLRARFETLLQRVPARHTITRFPARILQLYRNLALVAALPLAYALVYRIGSDAVILLYFLETAFLSSYDRLEDALLLFLLLLAKLALPVLLAFWIYRGIYGLLGLIAVYVLGNQLVLIEREQPVHLSIDPEAITIYASQTNRTSPGEQVSTGVVITPENVQKLAWSEITEAVTVNYRIISRPIDLISRMLLRSGSTMLMVEGLTLGYHFLRRDIEAWLARRLSPLKLHTNTFTFLEWRSTLVVSTLVLAFISYLFYIGQIEVSVGFDENVRTLPISTIIQFSVLTLLSALPAVILWRVLIHRFRLDRKYGKGTAIIHIGLILAAALLTSVIAVRWILYLALTK
jgi:tetratricopeptide (TPR) repeat protein